MIKHYNSWDNGLLQTHDLTPMAQRHFLLNTMRLPDYDSPPPFSPEDLALVRLLLKFGAIAFRVFYPDAGFVLKDYRRFGSPKPTILQTMMRTVGWRQQQPDILITRDEETACLLFANQWEVQGQAAMVLEGAGLEWHDCLQPLYTRKDWRDYRLQSPVKILMMPGVDGCYAQLSCADQSVADRLKAELGEAVEWTSEYSSA